MFWKIFYWLAGVWYLLWGEWLAGIIPLGRLTRRGMIPTLGRLTRRGMIPTLWRVTRQGCHALGRLTNLNNTENSLTKSKILKPNWSVTQVGPIYEKTGGQKSRWTVPLTERKSNECCGVPPCLVGSDSRLMKKSRGRIRLLLSASTRNLWITQI